MGLPGRISLSLRTRFVLGMGVMLLPLVVLAAMTFFSFQSVTNAIDDVVQEAKEELSTVLRLELLIQQAMIVAHDAVAQGLADPVARERLVEANRGVHKVFEDMGGGPFALQEERRLIQSAQEEWRQGRQLSEALFVNPRPAGDQALLRALERAHAHHNRALESLDQVHTLAQQEMNAQLAYAISVRRKILIAAGSVFAVGLGIAIMVGTALARSAASCSKTRRRASQSIPAFLRLWAWQAEQTPSAPISRPGRVSGRMQRVQYFTGRIPPGTSCSPGS